MLYARDLFTSIFLIPDDGFQLKPKHLHNPYYITARCGCGWLHTFSHIINSRVSCKTTIGSSVGSYGNFRIPDPTFCNVRLLLQTCSSVWLDFWSSYLIALQIRYITTICLSSGSCSWNYSGVCWKFCRCCASICIDMLTHRFLRGCYCRRLVDCSFVTQRNARSMAVMLWLNQWL